MLHLWHILAYFVLLCYNYEMAKEIVLPPIPVDQLSAELYFDYYEATRPLFTPTEVRDIFSYASGGQEAAAASYAVGQITHTAASPTQKGTALEINERKNYDFDNVKAAGKLVVQTATHTIPLVRFGRFQLGKAASIYSGSIKSTIPGRPFTALSALCDVLYSRHNGVRTLQTKLMAPIPASLYYKPGYLDVIRKAGAGAKAKGVHGLDAERPSYIMISGSTPLADIEKQQGMLSKIFDPESVVEALQTVYGAHPDDIKDTYSQVMEGTSDPHYAVSSLLGSLPKAPIRSI